MDCIGAIEEANVVAFFTILEKIKHDFHENHNQSFFNYTFQYLLFNTFKNRPIIINIFINNLLEFNHQDEDYYIETIQYFLLGFLNIRNSFFFDYVPHIKFDRIPWYIIEQLPSEQQKKLSKLEYINPQNKNLFKYKKYFTYNKILTPENKKNN